MLRRTKAGGFATATALVAASTLLYIAPAAAAPGDAAASGLRLDLGASLLGLVDIDAAAQVGAVNGNGSASLLGVDVGGLVGVDATVGAVDTESATGTTGSRASSEIAGADIELLGASLLSVGAASAEAICPVGAAPTAGTELADVTVLGQTVAVSADTPTVLTNIGIGVGSLAGLSADVTLERIEDTTADSAAASALQLRISVEGRLLGLPLVSTDLGSITLAEASCERPDVALTAGSVTPGSGPTVGGETVTITGTGFQPDTAVAFDGVAGTDVSVDPSGTSLTVVTPANTAGPSVVEISSGGSTATTAYDYFETTIASLSPAQGSTAGGTTVVIAGQNLAGIASATFGGAPAIIQSVSPTAVVVTTPAHDAGPVPVALGFPSGAEVVAPNGFTYVETAVLALAPSAGSELGGTSVRIDGTGLATATAVEFGGVPATIDEVAEDGSHVIVTTPAGTGSVAVTIDLAGGPRLTAPQPFEYLALDDRSVDGLSPERGSTLGGTTVVIDGDGLNDVVSVDFGGTPAVISDIAADGTSVTVVAPAHAVGPVTVTLGFSGGEELAADDEFVYVATAITGVLPTAGSELGGTTVTLSGSGLEIATGVTFGGVPTTDFVVDPDGRTLTVVTPPGTGSVPVVVALEGGGAVSAPAPYEYLAIADRSVAGFSPLQGTTTGGTLVTLTGDGLDDTTGVLFGTAAGTIVAVSTDGSSVQVLTPAGAVGTVPVTLQFSGGESLPASIEYRYVETSVSGIAPVAGSALGGTTVVITGTGLATAETVEFGGAPATIVDVADDGTSVTVTAPAGSGAVAVVVGLEGGTEITSPVGYEYLVAADRDIDGLSPAQGPTTGGTSVTFTGSGLHDIVSVEFGGVAGAVDQVSTDGTRVVVTAPAHIAGPVGVTLGTAAGESFQADDPFVYVAMAIDGLTPSAGSELGGTTVVIEGAGLGTAVSVEFGGVPATIQDSAENGSSITVTAPAGTGSVPVVISFDGGTSITAPDPYEYISAEMRDLDGLSPDSGSVNGGTLVTITGDYLHDAAEVTFDGVPGEIMDVDEDGTWIVVRAPEGDLGSAVLRVRFASEWLRHDMAFLYIAAVAPVIDMVAPASGPMTGGTTVVISGSGLGGTTGVTFGGVPGTIVGAPSGDTVVVTTPYGQVGAVDVMITTPDGSDTLVDGFEFTLEADGATTGGGGIGGGTGAGTTPTATGGGTGAPGTSQSGLASTGVQGELLGAIALLALLVGAVTWRRSAVRRTA